MTQQEFLQNLPCRGTPIDRRSYGITLWEEGHCRFDKWEHMILFGRKCSWASTQVTLARLVGLHFLHAATIYSSLHEGELAVPLKFVVPESTEGNGDGPTSCGAIG